MAKKSKVGKELRKVIPLYKSDKRKGSGTHSVHSELRDEDDQRVQ